LRQPAASSSSSDKKMDLDWGASRDSLRLLSTYSFDSCFLFLFFLKKKQPPKKQMMLLVGFVMGYGMS
jgi:hypothetical protein